jgi:hypothetical protein
MVGSEGRATREGVFANRLTGMYQIRHLLPAEEAIRRTRSRSSSIRRIMSFLENVSCDLLVDVDASLFALASDPAYMDQSRL